jgi:aldehyde dehydrogenase (NAD+)
VSAKGLFIDGRRVAGSGPVLEAINPYSAEPFAEVTSATAADVDAAVGAAAAAFDGWRRTPGVVRAELIFKLADALVRESDRLARIETQDNGKIIRETRNQLIFAARNYRFFAGAADKLTGETKPLDRATVFDYTTLEPLGVCALITAWNSPLQLLANKLAPALAAGNTVVVKPSEHTSVSTLEFADLINDVGFPPGVVNVVCGAAETGEALTTHPLVDKISFTGSVATGSRIAAAAARTITPVTLELGGKSANIVFADADLAKAIPGAVSGIFAAAGQTCVAGSRLLVHESIHDEVVAGVAERARQIQIGDPMLEATEMGPMAHEGQMHAVMAHVARARADGAELVVGGERPEGHGRACFVAPTIFTGVRNEMALAQEEIFGPVLAVIPFADDDEAIAIANDTRFGLAAGLWTRSIQRAHLLSRELRCGNVWVNTYRSSAAQAPFGGTKQSGYGRERGIEALGYYTRVKNTMIELSDDVRDPFKLGT